MSNCNNCSPKNICPGLNKIRKCPGYREPKSGWMLAELALSNPEGLRDTLALLPFKPNLNFRLGR